MCSFLDGIALCYLLCKQIWKACNWSRENRGREMQESKQFGQGRVGRQWQSKNQYPQPPNSQSLSPVIWKCFISGTRYLLVSVGQIGPEHFNEKQSFLCSKNHTEQSCSWGFLGNTQLLDRMKVCCKCLLLKCKSERWLWRASGVAQAMCALPQIEQGNYIVRDKAKIITVFY